MIIDSSAIIAVLAAEEQADAVLWTLSRENTLRIGAPSTLEVSLVADNRPNTINRADFDTLLSRFEIVPFDGRDAAVAREAHRRFGRGSGSPARLNFGDCMSYAIAKRFDEPLLFVGEDFTHTDIRPAL